MKINKINSLKGTLRVSSDKSISHRAIMLGSLATGTTIIKNFLKSDDCMHTIDCFRKLGVHIEFDGDLVLVKGKGLHGLSPSSSPLYVGNSGTTIRIMAGILAAQCFSTTITGDNSIKKRPMRRVIEPLTRMGAVIESDNFFSPMTIMPSGLKGITYEMPIASAQVKSAILMASLYADGQTTIIERVKSRNHSENMINYFGGDIKLVGNKIISKKVDKLEAREIDIPADISSASFFIVLSQLVERSEVILKDVLINDTRAGIIKIIKKMNGNIKILNKRVMSGEIVADLKLNSANLKGIVIQGDIIPTLIDEIPIIAVAAAFAEGTTIIKDAREARIKECDRLNAMCSELKKLGADIEEMPDGLIIKGKKALRSAILESHLDHRVAMSLAVAGFCIDGGITLKDVECIDVSYPNFSRDINGLI